MKIELKNRKLQSKYINLFIVMKKKTKFLVKPFL